MSVARRVPVGIALLFTCNVVLGLAPVVNFLLGARLRVLTNWLHLDSEASIPAWYSSMQWLCAAVLFALVPIFLWRERRPGWWLLAALALICLAFSIDEIVGMHEWVGRQSDALLPEGKRSNSWFPRTGIWPLLLGIPVVVALAGLCITLWRTVGQAHKVASVRMLVGFAIMFTGALLVELGANLIDVEQDHGGLALLQLVIEESLEMFGATLVVWSAYEFARNHGFALRTPDSPVSPPTRAHS